MTGRLTVIFSSFIAFCTRNLECFIERCWVSLLPVWDLHLPQLSSFWSHLWVCQFSFSTADFFLEFMILLIDWCCLFLTSNLILVCSFRTHIYLLLLTQVILFCFCFLHFRLRYILFSTIIRLCSGLLTSIFTFTTSLLLFCFSITLSFFSIKLLLQLCFLVHCFMC